jgi:hypothetical protein
MNLRYCLWVQWNVSRDLVRIYSIQRMLICLFICGFFNEDFSISVSWAPNRTIGEFWNSRRSKVVSCAFCCCSVSDIVWRDAVGIQKAQVALPVFRSPRKRTINVLCCVREMISRTSGRQHRTTAQDDRTGRQHRTTAQDDIKSDWMTGWLSSQRQAVNLLLRSSLFLTYLRNTPLVRRPTESLLFLRHNPLPESN